MWLYQANRIKKRIFHFSLSSKSRRIIICSRESYVLIIYHDSYLATIQFELQQNKRYVNYTWHLEQSHDYHRYRMGNHTWLTIVSETDIVSFSLLRKYLEISALDKEWLGKTWKDEIKQRVVLMMGRRRREAKHGKTVWKARGGREYKLVRNFLYKYHSSFICTFLFLLCFSFFN